MSGARPAAGARPAPRLLLIDNYDSFTWNLAQYLQELGAEVEVRLNDELELEAACARVGDGLVISPGPGRPETAGISMELIRRCAGAVPVLGVCLGLQAMAQVYGGVIVRAELLMHGKTSRIRHDGQGLFRGLPQEFEATRYHSLVVEPSSVPPGFEVSATSPEGAIMGLAQRELGLHGVQFHPESVLTLEGKRLLRNFLELVVARRERRGD